MSFSKILFVGLGGAGQRHLRIFRQLLAQSTVCDVDHRDVVSCQLQTSELRKAALAGEQKKSERSRIAHPCPDLLDRVQRWYDRCVAARDVDDGHVGAPLHGNTGKKTPVGAGTHNRDRGTGNRYGAAHMLNKMTK